MKIIVPLFFLSLAVARADEVSLAYDPSPSTNVNSHKIYFSSTTTNPVYGSQFVSIPKPGVTATITNLGAGVWYFQAVGVASTQGGVIESDPSNSVSFTNKHFGPINLRITGSSNNTTAIWIENTAASTTVQWSGDMQTWNGWAQVKTLDSAAPVGKAIFLSGVSPDLARYWRAVADSTATIVPSPLPDGLRLSPRVPPIP